MEEIYHEGEEGARKAEIEGAFLFLRVLASRSSPGEPHLALVRLSG
ncbi:MAG: hypothetical protein LBH51_10250 [Treponema sp.]|jgi:hypothetical protein|nr:hypothetical protein [Treponema sp.]